jgi:hypothetical protein
LTECKFCPGNEDSCSRNWLEIDGERRPRIPYTIPFFAKEYERCHDCGVLDKQYHHSGCDMETCINCAMQLISCDCHVAEDIKIPAETLAKLRKEAYLE